MPKEVCRKKNGRFVKKKCYDKYEKGLKKNLKVENTNIIPSENEFAIEGRRIIDMQELAKNLICSSCNSKLHLQNILSESRVGVHSIFSVECECCKNINKVHSGGRNEVTGTYDNNTALVLGLYLMIIYF